MDELKKLQAKIIEKYALKYAFLALFALSIILDILLLTYDSMSCLLFLFVVIILFAAYLKTDIFTCKNEYQSYYKKAYVKPELEKFFEDLHYEEKVLEPMAETVSKEDRESFTRKDYIKAIHNGVKFESFYKKIIDNSTYEGYTSTRIIFEGKIILLPYDCSSNANIFIEFRKSFLTFLRKDLLSKEFKTYNDDFNKCFYVHGRCQNMDAEITPKMIEKLLNASDKISKRVNFEIAKNQFKIVIPQKRNLLNPPSVFQKLDDEKIKDNIKQDILETIKYIDLFS